LLAIIYSLGRFFLAVRSAFVLWMFLIMLLIGMFLIGFFWVFHFIASLAVLLLDKHHRMMDVYADMLSAIRAATSSKSKVESRVGQLRP
jgi:hypothetical protein